MQRSSLLTHLGRHRKARHSAGMLGAVGGGVVGGREVAEESRLMAGVSHAWRVRHRREDVAQLLFRARASGLDLSAGAMQCEPCAADPSLQPAGSEQLGPVTRSSVLQSQPPEQPRTVQQQLDAAVGPGKYVVDEANALAACQRCPRFAIWIRLRSGLALRLGLRLRSGLGLGLGLGSELGFGLGLYIYVRYLYPLSADAQIGTPHSRTGCQVRTPRGGVWARILAHRSHTPPSASA